jgi:hypothetical protein
VTVAGLVLVVLFGEGEVVYAGAAPAVPFGPPVTLITTDLFW